MLDIQRQPGANVIDVVRQIRAEIPRLQRALPAAVKVTIVSDRTDTIRASVRDVQFTLILSVVLVVLVVLLFLRSVRATIIAGVALPLSLVTSFGVMWFAGFSLDNLSLMALTIGTGFVVDDAIVMIENIVRHMEKGENAMTAASKGAREIGFTVISLTMSLIAVFIPLLFMTGLVGRMFREFALTLTIAVITSAVVSLTLTPMMCSRILRHGEHDRPLSLPGIAAVTRFIDWTVEAYHRSLLWVLERQRATLLVTFATVAATVGLYIIAPKGFLPLQDSGSIVVGHRGRTGRVVYRDAGAAGRNRRRLPQGRRRRGRGVGGRRRPAQSDAERRAHRHHAEAARPAQRSDRGGGRAVEDSAWPACPGCGCSFSRCRTSRFRRASAGRSISTR